MLGSENKTSLLFTWEVPACVSFDFVSIVTLVILRRQADPRAAVICCSATQGCCMTGLSSPALGADGAVPVAVQPGRSWVPLAALSLFMCVMERLSCTRAWGALEQLQTSAHFSQLTLQTFPPFPALPHSFTPFTALHLSSLFFRLGLQVLFYPLSSSSSSLP